MKKITIILLLIVTVSTSSSLYSATMEEVYPEETVDMFLTSYCILAQNKGSGGYVILSDEMEYISSWLTGGTSKDFFKSLPPSTLTTPLVLPIDMALLITSSLDDRASVARLEEYGRDHQAVIMVMALKLYDSIILEDNNYAFALEALEKKANTLGLNPDDLYFLFLEEKGITKDQIIDQIINGKPADEIVMEALAIRNKQHRRSNKPTIIMLSALLFLFVVIFFLIKSGRLDKKEE